MTSRLVPWSPAASGIRQGSARGPTSSIPSTIHELDESAEECVELVQDIESGISWESSADRLEGSEYGQSRSGSNVSNKLPSSSGRGVSNRSLDRIIDSLQVGPRITVYLADNSPVDFVPNGGYRCRCPEIVDSVVRARNLSHFDAEKALAVWFADDSFEFEVQLKPRHNPFVIQKFWKYFLKKYSDVHVTENPDILVYVKRSVFFPIAKERQIMDARLLQLLFEEAKNNFLEHRYLFSTDDVIQLGVLLLYKVHGRFVEGTEFLSSIPLNPFFPSLFLSERKHIRHLGTCNTVDLIKQAYEETSARSMNEVRLRFLLISQENPSYGAALFHGVMEARPSFRLAEFLFGRSAVAVRIAISEKGLFVLPSLTNLKTYPDYLLALRYNEFTFCCRQPPDEAAMSNDDTACLMLTIRISVFEENGIRKGMEIRSLRIFSKQASLMDACLRTFAHNRFASLVRQREHLINGEELSDGGGSDIGLDQEVRNSTSFSGSNASGMSRIRDMKATASTFSHGDTVITNHFEKFYLHRV